MDADFSIDSIPCRQIEMLRFEIHTNTQHDDGFGYIRVSFVSIIFYGNAGDFLDSYDG
uniref:Uncharacterized protein n=1 Tax=Candidatus Kentrum sp. SD TaxID=2126332 RepID=A0A450YLZ3_9GAMM|nr:MAG: hypothetical protein BECKSD772F_GA0070984_11244 [Candidatus Kentron sp. SD]VFK48522.1 MAG: hypothetical protein BECKSD772E_GA0070983_11294 [Candidatus Kentron sp. SD]